MTRLISVLSISALILSGTLTEAAWAYVGPGAGLSLFSSVIGLVVAVLAALGAILLWPVRRWLKRRKAGSEVEEGPDLGSDTGSGSFFGSDDGDAGDD